MANARQEGSVGGKDNQALFVFPNIDTESGEIERVAKEFARDNYTGFAQRFQRIAEKTELTELSQEDWQKLENSDSYGISIGDWEKVAHLSESQRTPRDWQELRSRVESGESLDAPMILKADGKLHLVSGNTRLMVARALGKRPQVLIVDMARASRTDL